MRKYHIKFLTSFYELKQKSGAAIWVCIASNFSVALLTVIFDKQLRVPIIVIFAAYFVAVQVLVKADGHPIRNRVICDLLHIIMCSIGFLFLGAGIWAFFFELKYVLLTAVICVDVFLWWLSYYLNKKRYEKHRYSTKCIYPPTKWYWGYGGLAGLAGTFITRRYLSRLPLPTVIMIVCSLIVAVVFVFAVTAANFVLLELMIKYPELEQACIDARLAAEAKAAQPARAAGAGDGEEDAEVNRDAPPPE